MTDLVLDSLTVGWNAQPVLRDVDLHVAAGTTVALLGESGSGKSTLLRTVAGLLAPLAGRVCLGERDVSDVPPHRRGVGMVFQGHALFPHATVAGNVAFGPRMAGIDRRDRATLVATWLERVGLDGLGDRDVATLSGGQRQRVALARTLAAEPAVVLLDEPLGALDTGLRASLLAELRELFASLGTTVVHVTHDPGEAATLASRVAVLAGTGIAQQGAMAEVHQRPCSDVVARLLGHPNVVAGHLLGLRGPQGRPIAVVPPSAVRLAPPGTADGASTLDAVVQAVSPGPTWLATLRLRTPASPAVDLVASVEAERAPQAGERVTVALEPDDVVWAQQHSATAPET